MESRRKPINDAQMSVLKWIGDGCPSGVYPPGDSKHVVSALALRNRGLVTTSGRGRQWSATLTKEGLYYLRNGSYPPNPTTSSPTFVHGGHEANQSRQSSRDNPTIPAAPAKSSTPSQNTDASSIPDSASPCTLRPVPIPSEIHRPHPAIRELMNHKKRLNVPDNQRHRALLILHALVQEAIHLGWTVTANPSIYEMDQWTGRRRSVSPGPNLFTIDAGHEPVTIRLCMRTKRVEHVPTEEEQKETQRTHWRTYSKYDYVITDHMQLELRVDSRRHSTFADTASRQLETKLAKVLSCIKHLSDKARDIAEQMRQEELRRLEQARAAKEFCSKASVYEQWLTTLDQLRSDIARHKEYESTVVLLRKTVADCDPDLPYADRLADYLAWAETYLKQSDPFRRIALPPKEVPEISYEEWIAWKNKNPTRQYR